MQPESQDGICHVMRAFEDDDVIHAEDTVDPATHLNCYPSIDSAVVLSGLTSGARRDPEGRTKQCPVVLFDAVGALLITCASTLQIPTYLEFLVVCFASPILLASMQH